MIKDSPDLELTLDFLKIITDRNRLKIIYFLLANNEQCVCKIHSYLELAQNLISHHLKVLKNFGLLNSRKEGLNVYYSINNEEFEKQKKILIELLSERGK